MKNAKLPKFDMLRALSRVLVCGLVLLFSAQAQAQSWFERNQQHGYQKSGNTADFDFYVLALSWSPGFCEGIGAGRGDAQCRTGARLGFIVHGLWPQYANGFPQNCGETNGFPTRATLENISDLYPDVGLARYEWRKHGTCSGKSPEAYFADVRRARDSVAIPDMLKGPVEEDIQDPRDIIRAFTEKNRGLRADMMFVGCPRDALQEVRICFSKDMRNFQSCPNVARSSCRSGEISVAPVR